ncbi:MAG: PAS domain S-box protein [Candidatus Rokubacteria bacterium]|nr:PAS domain S-box protein [Candidatus Rokubacteria bacterium]
MSARIRGHGLRTQLIVLACAVVLPMLLFTGVVVWVHARDARDAVETALRAGGQTLALSVDAQLSSYTAALETLAISAALDSGDLARFYRAAVRARAASPDWVTVALADPSGRLVLDVLHPFEEQLPPAENPEVLRRVFETGRPAVSDLFVGTGSGERIIWVAVPVTSDGQIRYVLTAAVRASSLSDSIARRPLPPGWTAAILDRRHVTVARTGRLPELPGEPATPERIRKITTAGEGSFLDTTPEGGRVYTAVTHSPRVGWTVLLDVPVEAVHAPIRRSLVGLGGGGLVVALVAVLLAPLVGRRIAGSIASLSDAAAALGRGEAIRRPPSSVLEVEQVARSLEAAAAERSRAEASLRENERFYRSLMENALDMVTVVDATGRVVYDSPAVTRILGLTPDERIGQPALDLVHPDDRPGVAARIAEGFRVPGTPHAMQLRVRHQDGSWRRLDSIGQVFVDHTGAALAVVNSRDVTDQRRAQEEIALQASALNAAANAIVITDREARIVWVNEAFTRMTGYPAAEALGQTTRLLRSGQHDHAFYGRLWEAVLSGAAWRGELVNRRHDGTLYTEEQVITPVRAGGGEITHFIAVKQDISERKRMDEELRQQREALYQTEKLAGMGQLLAGVAHELNSPLTVVTGRAAMLRDALQGGALGPSAQKLAAAAERCARIVKNFVALARQRPPARQEVSLNQVVSEAVELVAYALRVDDVSVTLDLDPALPPAWGDAHQLHQLVVNVVTNAHHAMRETPSPRRLRLTTRTQAGGQRLRLEVADSGPGVPDDIRERIFEPFFTTKPVGQGTGLGLSLCQGIAESHDGTIGVTSAPGQGATFVVELPTAAAPEPAGEPRETTPSEPERRGVILVVDDETEVGALLAELLTSKGHKVDTATDGLDALEKLGRRAYDLILSDIKMPRLDGPGLYRELERLHPHLVARTVFLTGDTLSREVSEFLEVTGRPSVSKPFDLDQIFRTVTLALPRN